MTYGEKSARESWRDAWPDALAFFGGLALAWFGDWQTKDLVWSLWLSSLLVGYAMIVWTILGNVCVGMWRSRSLISAESPGRVMASGGVMLVGGLFMLAFFTVHFGGFHFVHSVFLNAFFPITETKGFPGPSVYWEVLRSYWVFVIFAAVAERGAFKRPALAAKADSNESDSSVTTEAIARRKKRDASGDGMMAPYKNVVRLHLLIFFFAFASFTKLDNFLAYAVVSAVYFFPWRLLKREERAVAA